MEDIKLIGNLYNFNIYGEERFQKVQEMLDKYDDKSNFYDPTERVIEVSDLDNVLWFVHILKYLYFII